MNEKTFQVIAVDQSEDELKLIGEGYDIVIKAVPFEYLIGIRDLLAMLSSIEITVKERE